MNSTIQRERTRSKLSLIALVLAWFAFAPQMQAVNPLPDGCYPNFTTAEGCNALQSLTSGAGNSGVGWRSLFLNTTGNFNTGVGAGALVLNNADSNTALGAAALLLNVSGEENTAVGTAALVYNDTGSKNTAVGAFTLQSNTTGFSNTATGSQALFSNTAGLSNTASGGFALFSNTTGGENTATGRSALQSNTTGFSNTANGALALVGNTTGSQNAANGHGALYHNTTGSINTANGFDALVNNTTGSNNTANGASALQSNTIGFSNTALGFGAGSNATTGSGNVYIGTGVFGVAGESNACYIASIFGQTSVSGIPVLINSFNKLGTTTSSSRFKDDIKPMERLSEALFAFKPVTFHYKKEIDPARMQQFGLVAEDVEKINPDLVVRDNEGKPYSVRYEQVNAMLLNEFLKEHRKNEEREATIARQQKQIEALAAGLQKVNARLAAASPSVADLK